MWFKGKDSDLEKQLIEIYTNMKTSMGMSKGEAEKIVKDMLAIAKQKMKESGQDKLPPNFGNLILQKEKEEPTFMNMHIKRKDGVKDEDILWFWNMHPLEQCMLQTDDENSRIAAYLHYSEQGMNPEDAAKELRKFFSMFGNPENTEHTQGDDRPLPVELKDRINIWVGKNTNNIEAFRKRSQQYSTMNAFIRAEIRAGNI